MSSLGWIQGLLLLPAQDMGGSAREGLPHPPLSSPQPLTQEPREHPVPEWFPNRFRTGQGRAHPLLGAFRTPGFSPPPQGERALDTWTHSSAQRAQRPRRKARPGMGCGG